MAFLAALVEHAAADDEVAGINVVRNDNVLDRQPVKDILDTAQSCTGMVWIRRSERPLEFFSVEPESRPEYVVFLRQVCHGEPRSV